MIGVDVGKASLSYSQLDPRSQQLLAYGTVANDPTGIAQLLAQVPSEEPWVLEATGRYGDALVAAAQAAGRTVLHAPPRQAQAFLRAVQPRAKTDRLDSLGLARYALAVPLRPYPRKSPLVEELSQLLAARRGLSQALMRLRQQRRCLPLAESSLARAIAAVRAEQRALDGQLAAVVADSVLAADVARLQTVPGIGALTATALAVCLHSKQFAHPDQFVAYIGLDVRVHESGQRRGRAQLSHHGDAELRRLLYSCALASVRAKPNPFGAQYARERAKGLPSTAAACAVARKLARTCWSLVTHQSTYDAVRVGRQG